MPVVGVCHFPNHRTVCSGRPCRLLSIRAGHSTAFLRQSLGTPVLAIFPGCSFGRLSRRLSGLFPGRLSGWLLRSFGLLAVRPDQIGRQFDRLLQRFLRSLFPPSFRAVRSPVRIVFPGRLSGWLLRSFGLLAVRPDQIGRQFDRLLQRFLRSLFPPSFRAVRSPVRIVFPGRLSGWLLRSFGLLAVRPDQIGRQFDRLLQRFLRSLFPPSFRAVFPGCSFGRLSRRLSGLFPGRLSGRLFRSFWLPAIRPDLFGRLFVRCSPTAVPRPLFPDRHSLVCPFPSVVPPIAFPSPPFVATSSCPCRAHWGRELGPGTGAGRLGREFGAALRSGRGGRGRRVRGARSRNGAPPRRSAPP